MYNMYVIFISKNTPGNRTHDRYTQKPKTSMDKVHLGRDGNELADEYTKLGKNDTTKQIITKHDSKRHQRPN